MQNNKTNKQLPSCCKPAQEKKPKGFLAGILYGLLPHTGCIAFVLFTIFGVTAAASVFGPLLATKYFFYGLIALSFVFATISAVLYLRKNQALHLQGIKHHKGYLSILYGTTMAVNLLLFFVVFPYTASAASFSTETGSATEKITLDVDIPCSGHAPLIIGELKATNGITGVTFTKKGYFDVTFDPKIITESDILSIDIFDKFPARVIY